MTTPLIGVIMGSKSDWETMRHTIETLEALNIPFEARVVSAHRTPDLLFEYAAGAEERGLEAIIAGAGGAAHFAGNVRGENRAACDWRSGRIQSAERAGFASFYLADACRNSGRHARHWSRRGDQRGPARGGDSCQ